MFLIPCVRICHVPGRAETLYVQHTFIPDPNPDCGKRADFIKGELYYKNVSPKNAYAVFNEKNPALAMDKGHLAPNADFCVEYERVKAI